MTNSDTTKTISNAAHKYSESMIAGARNIGFAAAAMTTSINDEMSQDGRRVVHDEVSKMVTRGQAILDQLADARTPDLLDRIDEADARHVLWHFGDRDYGIQPGSFIASLITTLTHADLHNRVRLTGAFPGIGLAVGLVVTVEDGAAQLRHLLDERGAQ